MKIKDLALTIVRQKKGEETLPLTAAGGCWEHKGEKVSARVTLREENGILSAWLEVELTTEPFRENDLFSSAWPVTVEISVDELPSRMTALHLHRDWWTRPVFITRPEDLPERTQFLCMETSGGAACLLPMVGNAAKCALFPGRPGVFTLRLTANRGGVSRFEEPLFFLAEGKTVYASAASVMTAAARYKGVPLREDRRYPEMFEYLGWCSWDAFYTDISEDKVRRKAAELMEKKAPVRWFLMDDGWLSVRDQKLYDLLPEKEKFPNGFAQMIRDLRSPDGIRWFGVWHALGGYWGGVEPGSKAAIEEKEHLCSTGAGKLLPYPEAEKGYGFFRDWYELLRNEGIDFVKVDGQSAVKNYFENELPLCEAARGMHRALEGAAAAYMDNRLVNCMGMAMENVLGRPGSGVSRNSDDFVPGNENGFAEHLLQNAYNALYHNVLYHCDWDMYWTSHADAEKHGILRAVSGGPIYFSDRIGETNADAVRPLVYHDGRITRLERAAMPAPDCLFADPTQGGLMKVTNLGSCGTNGKAGAVAVYNLGDKEASAAVSAADIFDLPEGNYLCFDWKRRRVLSDGETVTLPAGGCGLYLLLPKEDGVTPVGLLDKYASFHALESVKRGDGFLSASLRDGGTFGFLLTDVRVTRVLVDGQDRTADLREENGLATLETGTQGSTAILIFWERG